MTAGVLLTGGRSTRLGVDKATLVIDGATLAERAAVLLREVCDDVVEVGDGVSGLRAVREVPAFSGPAAAVLAGVAEVGTPAIVLACDHARMTIEVLARLADDARDSVVPIVDGRAQYVAARYGPKAVAALERSVLQGDRSFRALDLEALGAADPTFPSAPFFDVDSVVDLDVLRGH